MISGINIHLGDQRVTKHRVPHGEAHIIRTFRHSGRLNMLIVQKLPELLHADALFQHEFHAIIRDTAFRRYDHIYVIILDSAAPDNQADQSPEKDLVPLVSAREPLIAEHRPRARNCCRVKRPDHSVPHHRGISCRVNTVSVRPIDVLLQVPVAVMPEHLWTVLNVDLLDLHKRRQSVSTVKLDMLRILVFVGEHPQPVKRNQTHLTVYIRVHDTRTTV